MRVAGLNVTVVQRARAKQPKKATKDILPSLILQPNRIHLRRVDITLPAVKFPSAHVFKLQTDVNPQVREPTPLTVSGRYETPRSFH